MNEKLPDERKFVIFERKSGFWDSLVEVIGRKGIVDLTIIAAICGLVVIAKAMVQESQLNGALIVASMILGLALVALMRLRASDGETDQEDDEPSQLGDDSDHS